MRSRQTQIQELMNACGAPHRLQRTNKRTCTVLKYTYDNIYQLLTAKQGTTTKESYTYDAWEWAVIFRRVAVYL